MGRVDADGVAIDYQVTGEGRPVILLHGFPDSGRLWRHQVPALATAGFQVIVPDLRGYGQSGKPEAVEAYSIPLLAGDVLAVLADLNLTRAHVVGHDWGAALAWGLAALAPGNVDHLVALSVGHPATFRRTPRQREKSWYMLLFQFPGIAERWLADNDWANFRDWAGHPDTDNVIAELEANGSLTPALNYYRANLPPQSWIDPPLQLPPVQAPVMGRVEHRGRSPHRNPDDRLSPERRRPMAIRAPQRRPLAPARRPPAAQLPAPRLPAPLNPSPCAHVAYLVIARIWAQALLLR
jgi:pimeloyl-ACP methyl ester carboxylesterase